MNRQTLGLAMLVWLVVLVLGFGLAVLTLAGGGA